MKNITLALFAASAFFTFTTTPDTARAQTAMRTWVSGAGSDGNACTRGAPCKTFSAALAKTAVNGEVNCIDGGDFSSLTIFRSVTIDCTAVPSSIFYGATGIFLNFDGFASSDVRKTVNIRGLTLQGGDLGNYAISIAGDGTNSHVHIQDLTINGSFSDSSSPAAGINDTRTNGNLVILNTTVRNMYNGIVIKPAGNTPGIVRATLDNVTVGNAGSGLTSSSGADIQISNSVFTENSVVGIQVGPGAQATIRSSKIAHNGTGLSAAGTLSLAKSSVFLNANAAVSGTVQSYGDNRFVGAIGGTLTPIGSSSAPSGKM